MRRTLEYVEGFLGLRAKPGTERVVARLGKGVMGLFWQPANTRRRGGTASCYQIGLHGQE